MNRRWLCSLGGLVCLHAPHVATAQEWTRFRGPNGSGLSFQTTLPVRWPEKDYAWKVKLPGRGHSSPVLWGKRIFITSGDDKTGTRMILCRHADDGRQPWRRDAIRGKR
jgi:outer membrane protein assembly factor BamB